MQKEWISILIVNRTTNKDDEETLHNPATLSGSGYRLCSGLNPKMPVRIVHRSQPILSSLPPEEMLPESI